jgi:hypothetical protein
MNKKHLVYVRIVAISLSCIVAVLTLFNLLTVVTHGIEIDVPDGQSFAWAVDPVEQRVLILTNFTVKNHGAYDIDDIDVNARLGTDDGVTLLYFSMKELTVTRGSEKRFDVIIPFDLDDIDVVDWFPLLYSNTNITLCLDVDADYMYRLVHVTVDETLTYQWKAPLSGGLFNDVSLPNLRSVLAMAQNAIGDYTDEIKITIVEYAMTMPDFEYLTDEGYGIWVNNTPVMDEMTIISCEVSLPIEDFGRLNVAFAVEVGLPDGVPYAELKEVSVSYVAE